MFVFYDWSFPHVYFAKNVADFPFNSWLSFQRLYRLLSGWHYSKDNLITRTMWTDSDKRKNLKSRLTIVRPIINAHTHTHPFNGPLSGTTQVSRYQKGKTNLDFTEARDREWQWHQLGICKSAPRSRQITTPAPHRSVFYRPDALPAAQPTASKHWRHYNKHIKT